MKNYKIYKKIEESKSYILIAHINAKISLLFTWGDMVVLMNNADIRNLVFIGQNSIVGPNSTIHFHSNIGKENIFLDRVIVHQYLKIFMKNIFLGNNDIGRFIRTGKDIINTFKVYKTDEKDKFQQTKELMSYLEGQTIMLEIGNGNVFLLGVKIGCFTQIRHLNFFNHISKISDHVAIGCLSYFGINSRVGCDIWIKNRSQIREREEITEHSPVSRKKSNEIED